MNLQEFRYRNSGTPSVLEGTCLDMATRTIITRVCHNVGFPVTTLRYDDEPAYVLDKLMAHIEKSWLLV